MTYTPYNDPWVDYPDTSTPITADALNHIEAGIGEVPYGPDFSANNVPVWDGSGWVAQKITESQVTAGTLTNTSINASAGISISKLASYPSDATKYLRGDGTWAVPSSSVVTFRKTTTKTVNTTTAATDLLDGEITVTAGALGTTGMLRLCAWGDWKNNSGGASGPPRLQLVLGGSTLIDTGSPRSNATANSTTRYPWQVEAKIMNTGSSSAQVVKFSFELGIFAANGVADATFTTGTGVWGEGVGPGSTSMPAFAYGVSTGSVDTSSAVALVLNTINGSNSASYETKLFGAVAEVV